KDYDHTETAPRRQANAIPSFERCQCGDRRYADEVPRIARVAEPASCEHQSMNPPDDSENGQPKDKPALPVERNKTTNKLWQQQGPNDQRKDGDVPPDRAPNVRFIGGL